jgi:hypothetical protein
MVNKQLIDNIPSLISHYHDKAKQSIPVSQSLTKNQIKKLIWSTVKKNPLVTLEDIDISFNLKLESHLKLLSYKLQTSNFKSEIIGSVTIRENQVIFKSDEHSDLTVTNPKSIDRLIQQYETERCCAVINDLIHTRLDITK